MNPTEYSQKWRIGAVIAILAMLFGLLPVPVVRAADQVVTNTNDSGAGSLRQAIASVHSGGTITFDLTYPATIVLTSGQLVINKELTIAGPGADSVSHQRQRHQPCLLHRKRWQCHHLRVDCPGWL